MLKVMETMNTFAFQMKAKKKVSSSVAGRQQACKLEAEIGGVVRCWYMTKLPSSMISTLHDNPNYGYYCSLCCVVMTGWYV